MQLCPLLKACLEEHECLRLYSNPISMGVVLEDPSSLESLENGRSVDDDRRPHLLCTGSRE